MKTCRVCGKDSDYWAVKCGKLTHQTICKSCLNEKQKQYYRENINSRREYQRNYKRKVLDAR